LKPRVSSCLGYDMGDMSEVESAAVEHLNSTRYVYLREISEPDKAYLVLGKMSRKKLSSSMNGLRPHRDDRDRDLVHWIGFPD
jgi:hypothetical protein